MPTNDVTATQRLVRDLTAGLVVLLVALPLCLGVAKASEAPYFAGILAGIIGGIVVGLISGSHTSVSGPAAGLTAVVAAQINQLGSFETFLLALVVGGVIQTCLGIAKLGFLSAFFPNSVIKGLLAAIGIILILKQIPHILGHDADPEGEMSFTQPDQRNTFTEFLDIFQDFHLGAAAVGLLSVLLLVLWDRSKALKKTNIPSPLIAVMLGVALAELLRTFGERWTIGTSHLVQVPVAESISGVTSFLMHPDFSQWTNPTVYKAGLTIAIVASLETLLNLEAVDKLDPKKRQSPSSRELVAQGVGNTLSGLVGGIPVTSVIVRSSVNVNAGAQSKLSAITHGVLMLVCVVFLPTLINRIPLASLAAILLVTGFKLASPKIIKSMWSEGRYQFLPFVVTVAAIVLTDLLIGIMIGLAISIAFVLHSNLRRPLRRVVERHASGDVMRIELANQVSFLNKAALETALLDVPRGGSVLIDARNSAYIDPDVLHLIHEFEEQIAPTRGVQVSLVGFNQKKHQLEDRILYIDYCTRELQDRMTPAQVLEVLKDGNERFRTGNQIGRNLHRQINATAPAQHPMAVILSCIDSRTPTELVFDLGLGDIFSIRIAGNVVSRKVLASMEYSCAVGGAKLLMVMGHTRCGAITESVNRCLAAPSPQSQSARCGHLHHIVEDIQQAIDPALEKEIRQAPASRREALVDEVSRRNVMLVMQAVVEQSRVLHELEEQGRIAIVGGMYNVATGQVDILSRDGTFAVAGEHLAALN